MLDRTYNGEKHKAHLAFIARLPCVICHAEPVECAHIRMGDFERGKFQALAKKPSDAWVVPLCPSCHRNGPGAQHSMGERNFWERHHVDPLKIATLLFEASGDIEKGEKIVRQARRLSLGPQA